MPKPCPKEFRDGVVAVARQGQAPLTQIARDFGISETCLSNWMRSADIEDGNHRGLSAKEADQVRELKSRNRLPEQENEVLRRAAAYLSQANLSGKQSSLSSVRWPQPARPFGCRSRWRAGCGDCRPGDTARWGSPRKVDMGLCDLPILRSLRALTRPPKGCRIKPGALQIL
jgi:transposase